MKICLWGARANNAGLGIQTYEFYRNINPDATVVIDISEIDKKQVYPERFNGNRVTTFKGVPDKKLIDQWLNQNEDINVIFCMETAYNPYLFEACNKRQIVTILQYNFEFLDYIADPDLAFPTVLLSPSIWNLEKVYEKFRKKCIVDHLPVPVNTDQLKKRTINKINTFIHIAGYSLYEDRNGTQALLEAIPYVKSDCKFIFYSQQGITGIEDPRVEVRNINLETYSDLYGEGDCLLLPRRYGGLCLPCNEAMGSGMIVSMPRISPNIGMVHPSCLLPVSDHKVIPLRCGSLLSALFDKETLAKHIDYLCTLTEDQVQDIDFFQYMKLPKWSYFREVYLNYMEQVLNTWKPSLLSSIPQPSSVPKTEEGSVLCKVRRTFCDGGTLYTSRQLVYFPEAAAKRKAAQKLLDIVSEDLEI